MLAENFFRIAEKIRAGNWWYYKIPQLLLIAYVLFHFQTNLPSRIYLGLLGLGFCLIGLFSFGYLLNDVYDIDEDRLAGKKNQMENVRPVYRYLSLAVAIVLGFIPWAFLEFGLVAASILFANYTAPFLYSHPKIRLKERGIWGIIADAAGVHGLPTLLISLALSNFLEVPINSISLFIVLSVIWAFLYGLRGILIHQMVDLNNDLKAGSESFVSVISVKKTRRLILFWIFPFEIIACILLLIYISINISPIIFFVLLVYPIYEFVKLKFYWKQKFDPAPTQANSYIPPSVLYEVWFPFSLTISLGITNAFLIPLSILHLILFYRPIRTNITEILSMARNI